MQRKLSCPVIALLLHPRKSLVLIAFRCGWKRPIDSLALSLRPQPSLLLFSCAAGTLVCAELLVSDHIAAMASVSGQLPSEYSLDFDTTELENILGISPSPSYTTGTGTASPGQSGPSEPSPSEQAGPSTSRSPSPSPTRGPKAARKRVRQKINLAPGQPPTARGNPRIRVFVACYQW